MWRIELWRGQHPRAHEHEPSKKTTEQQREGDRSREGGVLGAKKGRDWSPVQRTVREEAKN